MEILKLHNVIKIFAKENVQTRAVDGISFSMQKSQFTAIMGASGSGKTTLLNMIATIDTVSGGEIYIGGRDITQMGEKDLAKYRRDNLGFVFQEYNLLDTLTVYENITLPLALQNTPKNEIIRRAEDLLGEFSISSLRNKFPDQISGGERQRTACARALITNPTLILADEPTGALDSKSSKTLMQLLKNMNQSYGATILTVTHDPIVASYADRILFLKDGKIYNETAKGEKTGDRFLKEIIDINTAAGGESYVR